MASKTRTSGKKSGRGTTTKKASPPQKRSGRRGASPEAAVRKPVPTGPRAGLPHSTPKSGPLDRLAADQPRLTDTQRRAFLGQFSEAQCDELGGRTKAALVHGDALAWAALIDKNLRERAGVLRRYTRQRFAWYLECVGTLADAIEGQRAAQGRSAHGRGSVDKAREAGLLARAELAEALAILAGGDDARQLDVVAAQGDAGTSEALAASLRALSDLANGWLERFDMESHALVASVGLSRADVESALDCAGELTAESDPHRLASPRSALRDTPAVDRAEGRVLLEMRLVMRVFSAAHERTRLVAPLVPGPGTRAVLRAVAP